jgi:hypothetical protein
VAWYHRLLNIVAPNRLSSRIEREIDFHLAERADDLRAAGLADREAADQARRRFGNAGLYREQVRDADLLIWLDTAVGDFRYAWRALRRSPAFALAAVGSIAVGIGANVAIYTLSMPCRCARCPCRTPRSCCKSASHIRARAASSE